MFVHVLPCIYFFHFDKSYLNYLWLQNTSFNSDICLFTYYLAWKYFTYYLWSGNAPFSLKHKTLPLLNFPMPILFWIIQIHQLNCATMPMLFWNIRIHQLNCLIRPILVWIVSIFKLNCATVPIFFWIIQIHQQLNCAIMLIIF